MEREDMDFQHAKQVARLAAVEAGRILNQYRKQSKSFVFKGKQDIVSQIDIEAEQVILQLIQTNFPEHQILSEECGQLGAMPSDYCWIVDPVDGTINYVHDAAPFRVGICLLYQQKPILSTVLNPVKEELYTATWQEESLCNDHPIRVSSNRELARAVVMTHLPSRKQARAQTLHLLDTVVDEILHLRMFGSGLSALTYVAAGKFDVFFNVETYPWDILPGALLIEQAGGKVTDLAGNPVTAASTSVLATNGWLHEPMLDLLRKANQ